MYKFFELCFYTGLLYVVVSFIFGEASYFVNSSFTDLNLDIDIPDVMVSPLRPTVIATFVTSFGGIGLMCQTLRMEIFLTVVVSLIVAFSLSFLLYRFIIIPLIKAQNTSSPKKKQLIGYKATLNLGIHGDSFGEIIYVINGNSFNSPAKSVNNEDISRGAEVIIIDIKDGVFFVQNKRVLD